MALSVSQLASITQEEIVPELYENVFNANPLLFRLKEKGIKKDGGLLIQVPLAYASTTSTGWFEGYDPLNTSPNDQITAAQFNWRQLYSHVAISGREELQNSGKNAMLNLLEAKRTIAERTMEDQMGTAVQGSNSAGNEIDGLAGVLSTSSTYGGIAVADFAAWVAKVPSLAVAGTLTKYEIQKLIGQVTIGADRPTVLVTRQSVYDKIWSLWEGQQRFEDGKMADAGFQSMRVNGLPLIVDPHVTGSDGASQNNWLEALNERYLFLFSHKDCDFKVVPIPPQRDQDVKHVRILWAGNLVCTERRMQGAIKTIDPAL